MEFSSETRALACPDCGTEISVPADAIHGSELRRCLVCPSKDLYARKDFPQRLGVAIVVVGLAASCVAWAKVYLVWTFAILFATALFDVVLFFVVGNALMCYRCHAQYRGVEAMEDHGAFELETHERYRQMEARMRHDVEGRV